MNISDGNLLKSKAYINGVWVGAASGKSFEVTNPANGGALWQVRESVALTLGVENLTNSRIESGLTGGGLYSLGEPTSVMVGFKFEL